MKNKNIVKSSKSFISSLNEEKWLNKQGEKGLLLYEIKNENFCFKKTDLKYVYSAEFCYDSPKTPQNQAYIENMVAEGKIFCGIKGNFVYFANTSEIGIKKSISALAELKRRSRTMSIFGSVLSVFFLALFAYNVYYTVFFNSISYVIPANSEEILKIFNFIVGKNPALLFL
ncbi:MAG: DUF2812 domain-containing protein, partial [Clostridia bacterium]